MTSICMIADTHRRHREVVVPPCDVLIHCGDIGSFGEDEAATFADADAWFAGAPAKHVLCVGGNHDFALETRAHRLANARLVEDELVEVEGLAIYGSPWCPGLPDFAYFKDGNGLAERWSRIPTGIDILITHTPPHGILDLPTGREVQLGCSLLRRELARIEPRLHVFGHVHASHGALVDGGTEYVNAAIVGGRDLTVRNQPTMRWMEPKPVGIGQRLQRWISRA